MNKVKGLEQSNDYLVSFADPATGMEMTRVVAADSEEDAARRMNDLGFFVKHVGLLERKNQTHASDVRKEWNRRPARSPLARFWPLALVGAVALVVAGLVLQSGWNPQRSIGVPSPSPLSVETTPPGPSMVQGPESRSPETIALTAFPKVSEEPTAAMPVPEPVLKLDGPWFAIPVRGEIGREVDAVAFADALREASRSGAKTIVIDIDTPGGFVDAGIKMAQSLVALNGHPRTVARVRNAMSAGMFVAVACDVIVMENPSTIGGAVAFSRNASTGSAEVDMKMNSLLAAQVSAIAESKGHSGDAVRAMMVSPNELWAAVDAEGKTQRLSSSRSGLPEKCTWRLVDSAATVLTFEHLDAARFGFALPLTAYEASAKIYWNEVGQGEGERLLRAANEARLARLQREQEAVLRQREAAENERRLEEQRIQDAERKRQLGEEISRLARQIPGYVTDAQNADPGKLSDNSNWNSIHASLREPVVRRFRQRVASAIQKWQNVRAGITDIAQRMEKGDLVQDMVETKSYLENVYSYAGGKIDELRTR